MNSNRNMMLPAVMGDLRTRKEVMDEIRNNRHTYAVFKDLRREYQEEFIEFCMGVRGMKMTYDTFFKYIFDAEVHPERLASLLSEIIGRPLKIMRELLFI